MTTSELLLKELATQSELSVKEFVETLHVSKQMIHRSLNTLVEEKKVLKIGRSPKTVYRLNTRDEQKISGIIPVPQKSLNKIEERISNAENTFAITETVQSYFTDR